MLKYILLIAIALGGGVGVGFWLGTPAAVDTHMHDAEAATYRCPMHPTIVVSQAGSCSICGMDLVKDEDEGAASAGGSPGSAREGSGGGSGRVVASRPPSLSRDVSLGSVPAQYKHLHRLHSAAVSMQKVARGWLTRMRLMN